MEERCEARGVGGKGILQETESKGGKGWPGGRVSPERAQCPLSPSEALESLWLQPVHSGGSWGQTKGGHTHLATSWGGNSICLLPRPST